MGKFSKTKKKTKKDDKGNEIEDSKGYDVDFNLSEQIKDLAGWLTLAGRNDLGVQIENSTNYHFDTNFYVQKGNINTSPKDQVLYPAELNKDGTRLIPSTLTYEVKEKLAGSNIILFLTPREKEHCEMMFCVIFATPSNKDNYFKIQNFEFKGGNTGKEREELWERVDDQQKKHYMNNGIEIVDYAKLYTENLKNPLIKLAHGARYEAMKEYFPDFITLEVSMTAEGNSARGIIEIK